MNIKFFTIPINNLDTATEELNKYIRQHNVVEFEKHLVQNESGTFWCIYLNTQSDNNAHKIIVKDKEIVDYKEILTEPQFKLFLELREIRRKLAKQDSVPAYAIFLDKELAEISKLETITISNIKKINGVGEKKIEKYGEQIINLINKK